MFWKQVDLGRNGEVSFEEFLVWYRGNFYGASRAGGKYKAYSILEYFYASLATKRILPVTATTLHRWREAAQAKVRNTMELEAKAAQRRLSQAAGQARELNNLADRRSRKLRPSEQSFKPGLRSASCETADADDAHDSGGDGRGDGPDTDADATGDEGRNMSPGPLGEDHEEGEEEGEEEVAALEDLEELREMGEEAERLSQRLTAQPWLLDRHLTTISHHHR